MASQHLRRLLVSCVTLGRFPLAALVLVAAVHQWWAAVLCLTLIAFATDWLDGQLARRWHVVSSFGTFLDPLSDKVICLVVLWLGAVHEGSVYLVVCAAIFTTYDMFTTVMRLALKRRTAIMVGASKVAKIKTAALMAGLTGLILAINLEQTGAGVVVNVIAFVLLGAASILALDSLLHYIQHAIRGLVPSPIEQVSGIGDIDFAEWHKTYGITCLLCDIEGTLSPWRSTTASQATVQVLKAARRAGIHKIGLVTNIRPRDEARVQKIAASLGADTYYIPRNFRQRKPNTYMLRAAMRELGVSPEQTAFIGDKYIDVAAGRRARLARIAWVERVGDVDQAFDRYVYRPLEPFIKWMAND